MPKPTRVEENKLYRQGISLVAGVDEVGRGAWAGPLVAAAVILPQQVRIKGIDDSKKLQPAIREKLYKIIIAKSIAYSVSVIPRVKIDKYGITYANRQAIINSVLQLSIKPDYVLIDHFLVGTDIFPSKSISKGDSKVVSIAAASIIAKVTRDRMMVDYHRRFPNYKFHLNKGYGTSQHRKDLRRYGLCVQHRLSFSPMQVMNK